MRFVGFRELRVRAALKPETPEVLSTSLGWAGGLGGLGFRVLGFGFRVWG